MKPTTTTAGRWMSGFVVVRSRTSLAKLIWLRSVSRSESSMPWPRRASLSVPAPMPGSSPGVAAPSHPARGLHHVTWERAQPRQRHCERNNDGQRADDAQAVLPQVADELGQRHLLVVKVEEVEPVVHEHRCIG